MTDLADSTIVNSLALTACKAVRARLNADYVKYHTWAKVGAENGISGGMAYRVAVQGYQPRDMQIRNILGLPPLDTRLCAELLELLLNMPPLWTGD